MPGRYLGKASGLRVQQVSPQRSAHVARRYVLSQLQRLCYGKAKLVLVGVNAQRYAVIAAELTQIFERNIPVAGDSLVDSKGFNIPEVFLQQVKQCRRVFSAAAPDYYLVIFANEAEFLYG